MSNEAVADVLGVMLETLRGRRSVTRRVRRALYRRVIVEALRQGWDNAYDLRGIDAEFDKLVGEYLDDDEE